MIKEFYYFWLSYLLIKAFFLSKDDKILVSRLKKGDKIAFKQLFLKYSDRIYYFTIKYINNKEEAEGITQEVFIKLWNKRFELKPELSFSSFLYMIAKNAVIDLLRKKRREVQLKEEYIPELKYLNGHDLIEHEELKSIIEVSIKELPEKRRHIYLLSREEGMTYNQIALELNISIKTVESHMRLALKQLKKSVINKYDLILIGLFFSLLI